VAVGVGQFRGGHVVDVFDIVGDVGAGAVEQLEGQLLEAEPGGEVEQCGELLVTCRHRVNNFLWISVDLLCLWAWTAAAKGVWWLAKRLKWAGRLRWKACRSQLSSCSLVEGPKPKVCNDTNVGVAAPVCSPTDLFRSKLYLAHKVYRIIGQP
jgi:hypothetical protein